MSDRRKQETYTSPLSARTVPAETCHEIALAWERSWPVTEIRPLGPGESAPAGSCEGAPGSYHLECVQLVVAVQHVTHTGEPLFYCYAHALETDAWNEVHYRVASVVRERERE